jgi:serine/threonine-protein kinase
MHDIGDDRGTPFLVLELLEGQDLRQRLRAGPLSLACVLDIAIPVVDVLQLIHGRNLIHLDITPGNIFITDSNAVKLLDFGLARSFRPSRDLPDATTRIGSVQMRSDGIVGTPGYASPEQVAGRPLDGRTDLFSLGAVLLELASGQAPQSEAETCRGKAPSEWSRNPSTPIGPACPKALAPIVTKALARERRCRFQSARELRDDLLQLKEKVRRDSEAPTRVRIRPIAERLAGPVGDVANGGRRLIPPSIGTLNRTQS